MLWLLVNAVRFKLNKFVDILLHFGLKKLNLAIVKATLKIKHWN